MPGRSAPQAYVQNSQQQFAFENTGKAGIKNSKYVNGGGSFSQANTPLGGGPLNGQSNIVSQPQQ